jgi:hypothetical protein
VIAPMLGVSQLEEEQPMRIISSIRTAALVAAPAVTARSQRAEPRPPPPQRRATRTASGSYAGWLAIDQERFDEVVRGERDARIDANRILDAVPAGARLAGRPS